MLATLIDHDLNVMLVLHVFHSNTLTGKLGCVIFHDIPPFHFANITSIRSSKTIFEIFSLFENSSVHIMVIGSLLKPSNFVIHRSLPRNLNSNLLHRLSNNLTCLFEMEIYSLLKQLCRLFGKLKLNRSLHCYEFY